MSTGLIPRLCSGCGKARPARGRCGCLGRPRQAGRTLPVALGEKWAALPARFRQRHPLPHRVPTEIAAWLNEIHLAVEEECVRYLQQVDAAVGRGDFEQARSLLCEARPYRSVLVGLDTLAKGRRAAA